MRRKGFTSALLCAVAAAITVIAVSAAQEPRLKVSTTPLELADQVAEIRAYLTEKRDVVIGEIVTLGPTELKEFTVPMEKEKVTFRDDGVKPDLRGGDGIFTAQFAMDTMAAFRLHRDELDASTRALTGDPMTSVNRGSRDTVPAYAALEKLRAAKVPGLENLRERTRAVLSAEDPHSAAKKLGVDFTREPMFVVKPGRFQEANLSPRLLFGIPFFPPKKPPIPIAEFSSLFIRDVGVVNDPVRTYDACSNTGTPDGVWSFSHLVRELAENTGVSPEDFVLDWLSTWESPQSVNGYSVYDAVRAGQIQARVIASWQEMSGPGPLDIDKFPARLLGIVNRPDLADKIGYGKGGSAGEGRFVFGLTELSPTGVCQGMLFTVILEYTIKGGSCSSVKNWQQRWKNLDSHPVGSAAFNDLLEGLTLEFTEAGVNPGQLPNQSALTTLRTGERGLNGPDPWELREFRLTPAGLLGLTTAAQTPLDSFNNTATLSQFLLENENDILTDKHVVPATYPTSATPFLGATPHHHFPAVPVFWNANLAPLSNPSETRRKFAVSTCNGCHSRETDTHGTHVGNFGFRFINSSAHLSYFIVGTGPFLNTPITGEPIEYDDLKERAKKMSDILSNSCFHNLAFRRIPFAH